MCSHFPAAPTAPERKKPTGEAAMRPLDGQQFWNPTAGALDQRQPRQVIRGRAKLRDQTETVYQ
jgi:hypothetical protein